MSASAAVIQSPVGGILPGRRPVLRWRHADVPAAGDLASVDLIAPSRALELPSLFGVEDAYIYNGGTTGVCELCKQLLRLEIGTLADWEESQHTPLKFIHLTLRHWMEKSAAPYSVGNSFGLELFLHNWIDEWSDFRRGMDQVSRLYLMLDCSEVEAFNIGETVRFPLPHPSPAAGVLLPAFRPWLLPLVPGLGPQRPDLGNRMPEIGRAHV